MKKPRIAMLVGAGNREQIFSPRAIAHLKKTTYFTGYNLKEINVEIAKKAIKNADGAITCWGSPQLTGEILDCAPNLKIACHSTGSVKPYISDEVWKRKIRVTTCAPAIGISVAEYALGLIITGLTGVYPIIKKTAQGLWRDGTFKNRGLYNITVGIVGAGFVGRHLISILKPFDVNIQVTDPFFSPKDAKALGVKKVDLKTLTKTSDVITLHAPALPQTNKMLNQQMLELMKPNTLLINTARGSLIDEKALARVLKKRKDVFACLDVTDPEPPAKDNPLRTYENVIITPHIAGTGAYFRLGDTVVEEIERFFSGKKAKYEVTRDALARMA